MQLDKIDIQWTEMLRLVWKHLTYLFQRHGKITNLSISAQHLTFQVRISVESVATLYKPVVLNCAHTFCAECMYYSLYGRASVPSAMLMFLICHTSMRQFQNNWLHSWDFKYIWVWGCCPCARTKRENSDILMWNYYCHPGRL